MTLSWDLIHTFNAVARTGSLLAAARSLGLSQPTVGRHMNLLEEALNTALFVRGREGMTLTAAGADLVNASQDMAQSAEAFQRQAAGLDQHISGVVRLSANDVLGVHVLPAILRDFMDAYPEIEVELDISNQAANLLRRDADVAIRMFRPVQNDLIARKVGQISVGFYAHQSYLKRNGRPESWGELMAHRLIGFDRETFNIDAARTLGKEVRARDFAFRCDNLLAHMEAVRVGLGLGILHQSLGNAMVGVERVMESLDLPTLDVWTACHAEVRYNRRIRLLMDFLGDRLHDPYGLSRYP